MPDIRFAETLSGTCKQSKTAQSEASCGELKILEK